MPQRIAQDARSELAEQRVAHNYARLNSKLHKPFCKIVRDFLELFLSDAVQLISCLSALNVQVAGATLGSNSLEDVEIWQEAQTSRTLSEGQRS